MAAAPSVAADPGSVIRERMRAKAIRPVRAYGRARKQIPIPASEIPKKQLPGVAAGLGAVGPRLPRPAPVPGPATVSLSVVGPAGEAVPSYRWLIEEDTTWQVAPGVPVADTPSVGFHRSYMPVVAHGTHATPPSGFTLDGEKRYFMSVLPDSGYSLGGAPFWGGDGVVTVRCPAQPLPTSQFSVQVFEDNQPLNAAPDLPGERGLAGFQVNVWEAGGRYGHSGGQVMQDVFGNPVGTTYNEDGSMATMGQGFVLTDENGWAIVKNLSAGKFTAKIVPPRGEGWILTSTIEGGKGVDAWVKPGEPPYFQEFGPPGPHTFFGFTKEFVNSAALNGGTTVSGQVVNLRMSRPPLMGLGPGTPYQYTTPYVALNDTSVGVGQTVLVKRCEADGSFTIPNVPTGNFQLVIFDEYLDLIIATRAVNVRAGTPAVDLGTVPVFYWFSQLFGEAFWDSNSNGFRDDGEAGLPGVMVNLRWRDGSIYQLFGTDPAGAIPFNEVFPFFAWLVAEVDNARFKITGATTFVDNGGPVDANDPATYGGQLAPAIDPATGLPYRTVMGPQRTFGFQGFIGQTNVIHWGKQLHAPGENGGISGAVYYDIMRGADDARQTAQELMEPGIPRVQVNLYGTAATATKADVDNWPLGNFPGPEDEDWNGNQAFDLGDAIAVTYTKGWDDNLPTGCLGEPYVFRGQTKDCFDGLRNFNQVREAVFDGMYSFAGIPSGDYVVEVVPPKTAAGDSPYIVTKEEDQNLDFGDEYVPAPQMPPPECAGALHRVPDQLLLFPGITPHYAGRDMPLCDRKKIRVNDGQNGLVDFFMFTEVPIAAHVWGFILDDAGNEFDPNAPNFGEKFAPPWMPVSIRDWDGYELTRTYSDEYGVYNALVPSTFTMNNPLTSGIAPRMLVTCMNDPGPVQDPANPGQWITDPHYNPQYSQFCYTFQYTPGTTTYLDTPVIPVAAFAGQSTFPLDCEAVDSTPRIYSVVGDNGGPYVTATGRDLVIRSLGDVAVPNPAWDGPNGTQPQTITRHYDFGAQTGSSSVTINGTAATIVSWSPAEIVARVATGTTTGQLVVTRGDNGRKTVEAVTVTVRTPGPSSSYAVRQVPAGGAIQPVIDAANPGDLILVPPGEYAELVVMWKPVRLQGAGAGSTHIIAAKKPTEKIIAWREKVMGLIDSGRVSLIPNQENGQPIPTDPLEPVTLFNEEGPGIIVLAKAASVANGGFGRDSTNQRLARIDGFTISGGDNAGGVLINGYARWLEIGNNRIQGNAGTYGGGVRAGHPFIIDGDGYQSAFNNRLWIHHNNINRNGGLEGAGGGISLYSGANNYAVEDNVVCGNYSGGDGGGIAHYGLSPEGVIQRNAVLFNESFFQQSSVHGGGIVVAGGVPVAGTAVGPGSGDVLVNRNLIQGNGATSGDGGGIAVLRANGADVEANPDRRGRWYRVDVFNNMILNNVAGLAGGGISLQDAARVNLYHNTITRNDSVGTAGLAFSAGSPNQSTAQPAGIVARAHSAGLAAAFEVAPNTLKWRVFSNPDLINSILWENRSFYFRQDPTAPAPNFGLVPDVAAGQAPVYWDLGVLGTPLASSMAPRFCDLTSLAGYGGNGNFSADPLVAASYVNGAVNQMVFGEIPTGIVPAPAFDEGGNWIKVRFGPITLIDPATGALFGDPHLTAASPVRDRGLSLTTLSSDPALRTDYDGQPRPSALGSHPDVGADQFVP